MQLVTATIGDRLKKPRQETTWLQLETALLLHFLAEFSDMCVRTCT